MPELPEVETIVRACRPRLEGRSIMRFRSLWARQAVPSVPAVRAGVTGRRIVRLERRGKFIVFALDDDARLLVHLRMSGRFEFAGDSQGEPRHVRAVWDLDDGSRLLFCDARKFGRVMYTRDGRTWSDGLGAEPLASRFTAAWLGRALAARARALKPLLLDQSVIAGLGNIYTDEALHRAGLHPLRRSDTVQPGEVRALRNAIRAVLTEGIRRQGTTIDWIYPGGRMQERLRVYGRGGEACDRCGDTILTLRVGQRGTHICPTCQPHPKSKRNSAGSRIRVPDRPARHAPRDAACAE